MELVDEVLGFLHAFADQNAFAGIVHLEHVMLGLGFGPAKNLLKHVSDIIHGVDGVVPANDDITWLE